MLYIPEKGEIMANDMEGYGKNRRGGAAAGASGGVYGLAFVGAAIYFIGHAASFWLGVLGFLKALVWPAFLIYGLLKHIGM
jgi:hypothetical protein